ncbi:MAG TPA: isoprenylcysteine carboxylmethyltransferase family protein [Bryobacteraceae bacterium]|jgi:protein-S-isoprenylcysteine O-methyltransferase Ste14|nr:isoprenylcysteine carboxylmethyltransferase family protein [Bryobacteraceae bacterium]
MLFGIAALELLVMWVLWLFPFLRKRFTGPKRQANVIAHRADWGLALETAGIFLAWLWLPNTPIPGPARAIASMVLAPIATVFGWLAVRHLGKQLRILAGLYADHELIRTGPYAIVRHPVYASLFLMMLATGLLFARWPLLLLSIVLYIAGTEIRIHAEEGLLRERFGEEFEEYRRQVPAYLPFLR